MTTHNGDNPARWSRGDTINALLAFVLPTIVLLPFATKAYHIDDTVYLRVAEQIRAHPFDFYGFSMNWYGITEPVYEFNKNPPGVSYFLALLSVLFGWEEIPLHAAMAVLTGLLSLGTYLLARRVCRRPLLAALIAALSPCVLVSGNTVMSDVPMVTYYIWALFFWVKGINENRAAWLWAAAVAIALSALHKYFGITALGLAGVYAFAVHRKPGKWLLPLLLPLVVVAAYVIYSYRLYGIELVGDAAAYAVSLSVEETGFPWRRNLYIGLGFLGGLMITSLFFAPFIWRPRTLLAGAAVFVVTLVSILSVGYVGLYPLSTNAGWNWPVAVHSAVFFVAGLQLFGMLAVDLRRNISPAAWLLLFWIVGTFVFSSLVNWTINARTLLPLAPACGILTARLLDGAYPSNTRNLRHWLALVPGAAIAIAVVWGDFWLANAGRTAAYRFARDAANYTAGTYYFRGHWGFQYYMERYGLIPLESGAEAYRFGDRVVVPQNNPVKPRFKRDVARAFIDLKKEVPASRWVTTMHPYRAAGFYMHFWGPLPYGFGFVPPEVFAVYEIGDWSDLP